MNMFNFYLLLQFVNLYNYYKAKSRPYLWRGWGLLCISRASASFSQRTLNRA